MADLLIGIMFALWRIAAILQCSINHRQSKINKALQYQITYNRDRRREP